MSISNEEAWNFAVGIVRTEGKEPSKEFLELVEKEKRGEIKNDDIRRELKRKYMQTNSQNVNVCANKASEQSTNY